MKYVIGPSGPGGYGLEAKDHLDQWTWWTGSFSSSCSRLRNGPQDGWTWKPRTIWTFKGPGGGFLEARTIPRDPEDITEAKAFGSLPNPKN
ncbi:hypothetical protein AVEN_17411-1 [Araneus ventricosus]|uniref:Uncharacterized protein n=1 Tax=Araneus ventricosus TaxID=182803 RepID=A0A4Y2H348_ARAVE|nr:hypothetical protein AVEN_17411-1 [Araneus ventricosus]